MKYTLSEINEIIFSGYEYKLPSSTINIINNLVKELGVSSSLPTINIDEPVKITKKNSFSSLNHMRKNKNMEESREPFKITVLEKKEGVDSLIKDIRICLNKISNKNYETQKTTIFEHMDKIIQLNTDENIQLIMSAIVDIASSNKFYSELYATLYKELILKYPIFKENITIIVKNYIDSISDIVFIDSNIDYDKYCSNNKLNDKRKAIATFIVNMMIQESIDKLEVINIIEHLQTLVMEYVDKENKIYEIEEITENILIFITLSANELKQHSDWNNIVSNITVCSQYKLKEHLSISNRVIFKFMDIMDIINKLE